VAVLLALAIAAGSVARLVLVGAFDDDGVYVALGKALANGAGYRSIHLAGAPVHEKYPPGLPAILALLWRATGSLYGVQAIGTALSTAAAAAAGGLFWWYARSCLRLPAAPAAFFVVGPFLLDPTTQYLSLILSEPYYLLAWALALVLADRATADGGASELSVRRGVALGLLLAAGALFRTQAASLLLVIPLLVARRGARRAGVACAASALVPLTVWWLVHARMLARGPLATQPDESYGAFAGGLGGLLAHAGSAAGRNATAYASVFGQMLTPFPSLSLALAAATAALAVAGGVLLARRHPALVLTAAANVALVAAWPFAQDRLALLVLPVLGLLAAAAWTRAAARIPRPARLAALGLLALLAGAVGARQWALRRDADDSFARGTPPATRSPRYGLQQQSAHVAAVARALLTRTPPDARVLSIAPAALYLYTERSGVHAAPAESPFRPSVQREPGRYLAAEVVAGRLTTVVYHGEGGRATADLAAVQRRCPQSLRGVWATDGGAPALFAVSPDDACLRALAAGRPTGAGA
jgi:hypothetical protein